MPVAVRSGRKLDDCSSITLLFHTYPRAESIQKLLCASYSARANSQSRSHRTSLTAPSRSHLYGVHNLISTEALEYHGARLRSDRSLLVLVGQTKSMGPYKIHGPHTKLRNIRDILGTRTVQYPDIFKVVHGNTVKG